MNKEITILYVEDDKTLAFVTKDNLEQYGYKIVHFENGQLAINNFAQYTFDLCILDIMLPKMDGLELAKRIRKISSEIPILFLSAKSQTEDRIQGLSIGADDYLTKPFSIDELHLKIEIFLKRHKITEVQTDGDFKKAGDYLLDSNNQLLIHNTDQIKLTQRETLLTSLFFDNLNQLLKREDLLLKLWGDDSYFNGRSLDVSVSRIRKYLKNDPSLQIENIRSIGFRLKNINSN